MRRNYPTLPQNNWAQMSMRLYFERMDSPIVQYESQKINLSKILLLNNKGQFGVLHFETSKLYFMERKDFIKQFAVGGSILLTVPVLFSSCSDDDEDLKPNNPVEPVEEITIDLTAAAYNDLAAVGGYVYKNNIIIFRTSDINYVALSKECTHSQCTVTYSHTDGNVPCPCHGSKFTTSGTVTAGPATTNLKKYTVTKNGNTLTIS